MNGIGIRAITCVFAFLASGLCFAADIYFRDKGGPAPIIVFDGDIVNGDSEKLMLLLTENPVEAILQRAMILNSRGGSVEEALKLAKIIENAALVVKLPSGNTCASACFILFASSPYRWAHSDARLLVHRPYFPDAPKDSIEHQSVLERQQQAILDMRTFLESRAVAASLVDKMMSYPSSDSHRVDHEELRTQMGFLSPLTEELTLRRCGLTNGNIFRQGREANLKNIDCIGSVLDPLRESWLRGRIGSERFRDAMMKVHSRLN